MPHSNLAGNVNSPCDDPIKAATALVADELRRVEERLLGVCGQSDSVLARAARDAVNAGGKRLRPLLALLSAQATGDITETSIDLAVAAEVTHLASLMHDDIVDEAATRRGRPSVRQVWGNRTAVLVGDYLAAQAYRELSSLREWEYLDIFTQVGAEMCIAEASQSSLDLADATEDDCIEVARGKTARLLSASCDIGALSAGADTSTRQALAAYGDNLGLAFQITDDLLDIYGNTETIGKDPGRDILSGAVTLPLVVAVRSAHGPQVRAAIGNFRDAHDPVEALRQLGEAVELGGGRAAARRAAEDYALRATNCLLNLPESSASRALRNIPHAVLARQT